MDCLAPLDHLLDINQLPVILNLILQRRTLVLDTGARHNTTNGFSALLCRLVSIGKYLLDTGFVRNVADVVGGVLWELLTGFGVEVDTRCVSAGCGYGVGKGDAEAATAASYQNCAVGEGEEGGRGEVGSDHYRGVGGEGGSGSGGRSWYLLKRK